MALVPVAPSISAVTPTGFGIAINPDGNIPSSYRSIRVQYGLTIKYVDLSGLLQDTKTFIPSTITTMTVFNAIPNTLYNVSLSAADSISGLNETAYGLGTPLTTLAATPTALPFQAIFSTTVTASWNAAGNPINTQFLVDLSNDPSFTVNVMTSGWVAQVGHIFSGLEANTQYFGRVKARNSLLQETPYVSLGFAVTPVGPDSVQMIHVVNMLTDRGVLVRWQPNLETNIASYKVYRNSTPYDRSTYQLIGIVPADMLYFFDKLAYSFGITYYYKVTAIDAGGNESSLDQTLPSNDLSYHNFEELPFMPDISAVTIDDIINDETPIGAVDDVNSLFTTINIYRPGTLEVFLNGVKQLRTVHYNEGPATNQFTFTDPPDVGSYVRVNYIKI